MTELGRGGLGTITGGSPFVPVPPDIEIVQPGSISLIVKWPGGSHDYSEEGCATLTFSDHTPGGCFDASWTAAFHAGDELPPDYANVEISDNTGLIWRGRLAPWDIPDFTGCDGTISFRAQGLVVSMGDKVFTRQTIYGPRPTGSTGQPLSSTPDNDNAIISLTIEGAIIHAVTQLCPNIGVFGGPGFQPYIQGQNVAPSSTLLNDETSDYLNRTAADVVTDLTALMPAPHDWWVRAAPGQPQGLFSWGPRNPGPRYQVSFAEGAKLAITRNPDEIVDQVVVGYEKAKSVTVPEIVTLPRHITRQQSVNMTGETVKNGVALQLGQAVMGQVVQPQRGWRYVITIPDGTPVHDLGPLAPNQSPFMNHRRILSGNVIRIVDLAPGSFGKYHSVPNEHFITEVRRNEKDGETVLTCGETPAAKAVSAIRSASWTGTHAASAANSKGIAMPGRDAGRVPIFGPSQVANPSSTPQAASIRYGMPAYENDVKQLRPEVLPPLPPPLSYQINADTAAEDGTKQISISATVAKGGQLVSPLEITKYFIWASANTTIEITVKLRSTGETVLVANLSGSTERDDINVIPHKILPKAVDRLEYFVTGPGTDPISVDWVLIGLWTARYFPTFAGKPSAAAPSN